MEPRDLCICGFQALGLHTHTGGPCSPSVEFPLHPQDNCEDCSGGGGAGAREGAGGGASVVIPTSQMEKQSLGTECSQDHRAR